jgi:hypothetical protein
MSGPAEPLSPRQHRRLIEIVDRQARALGGLAREAVNGRWLTDDECQQLSKVLLDVFLDHLDLEDEPDREGVEADELLSRVAMQTESYWSQ